MTVETWLREATHQLQAAGIATARLDALILLEDVTDKDRAWLLAHPETPLQDQTLQKLEAQLARRAGHEPLAYIRGRNEFYGREFKVTPATLQPRPETETMLELLFEQMENGKWKMENVIDVGTGSGCLAITAKLEWPELEVYATEINADALKVAKQNARDLGADVKFYQGNLLEPLSNLQSSILNPFAILANLPYVPDSHTINQAAMQEPKIAIFGGTDGLDLYRELFKQLASPQSSILNPQSILTESLPFQHKTLAEIARKHSYRLKKTEDFIQVFCFAN